MTGSVGEFERHRPRLRGLAYRMLGSVADADDVLQDAYLRWHVADDTVIREPLAWLTTIVSRLCIDRRQDGTRSVCRSLVARALA